MKRLKGILVASSVLFFILSIFLAVTKKNGYILNFQGYSSYSIPLLAICFSGIFAFLFVMIQFKIVIRILSSIFAFVCMLVLGFILAWTAEERNIEELQGHIIITERKSFLFAADISFYKKENFLFSKYIGYCNDGEDIGCTYLVSENTLIIKECGSHSNTCRTKEYELIE